MAVVLCTLLVVLCTLSVVLFKLLARSAQLVVHVVKGEGACHKEEGIFDFSLGGFRILASIFVNGEGGSGIKVDGKEKSD